jgi:hypothetical protein
MECRGYPRVVPVEEASGERNPSLGKWLARYSLAPDNGSGGRPPPRAGAQHAAGGEWGLDSLVQDTLRGRQVGRGAEFRETQNGSDRVVPGARTARGREWG